MGRPYGQILLLQNLGLRTGKTGWSVNKNRDRHINGACDNLIAVEERESGP